MWKKDVSITILTANQNFIDTLIAFKGKVFHSTFVYGEPDTSKRLAVWTSLCDIASTRDFPWFLTGDFNEITNNSEKSGGPERPESSFNNFRSFLSTCDLFDLKHTGNFLSWRGKRHTHLAHCRLDRAMANSSWSDMFPNGRSHYLQLEASDHRPLISTFDSKKKKSSRIFRYNCRLRDNEEISTLVSQIWNEHTDLPVATRISNCRHAISAWSKDFHINSRKVIVGTKEALDTALSAHQSDDDLIAHLNVKLLKRRRSSGANVVDFCG